MVGIAGSEEKCKWLIDALGFDAAVNYKSSSFSTNFREATPDGVHCYFDNVGRSTDRRSRSTIITNFISIIGRLVEN